MKIQMLLGFNTTYGAWFLTCQQELKYTFKRTDTVNNKTRQWDQLDTRIGLNIPLDLSGGRYFRNLNFGSNYVYRFENNNTGPNKDSFVENNFSYLSHFINYSQQVQTGNNTYFRGWVIILHCVYRHAISRNMIAISFYLRSYLSARFFFHS